MDPLNDIVTMSAIMVLWTSFVTGFLGSGHCVGMCGGLVFAAAPTASANFSYQIGRFFSYALLGLLGGYLGSFLTLRVDHPYLASVPTFLLGLFFIWMGVTQYRGKGVHLQLPKIFQIFSEKLFGRLYGDVMPQNLRAFLVGFFTFLLPCGFLYGAVLVAMSLQNPLSSMGVMIFFWLGTVPAMSFAPQLLKKILQPLQKKYPIVLSLLFISIGVATIGMRVSKLMMSGGPTCH